MGKYSNILLCTDMDGTMMNSEGKLSNENHEAINEFIKEDGKFCITTGRLPSHLLKFFDKSELICPMICCNGTCIYDFVNDKILYESLLDDKAADIVRYLSKHEEDISGVYYYFSDFKQYNISGVSENLDELLQRLSNKMYKIVVVMRNNSTATRMRDTLRELYGDAYDFSRSWGEGIEIIKKEATKGRSVKRLQKLLGDNRKIVAVGDYENDFELIKAADIGCAVGNARTELKSIADRIVCTNDEHAIAEIIKNVSDWV